MPYAKPNTKQTTLFGENEPWRDEWQNMPEYVQDNLLPEYSVKINFLSAKDLQDFSELIGQPITTKTKSVWFPAQQKANLNRFVYVDET